MTEQRDRAPPSSPYRVNGPMPQYPPPPTLGEQHYSPASMFTPSSAAPRYEAPAEQQQHHQQPQQLPFSPPIDQSLDQPQPAFSKVEIEPTLETLHDRLHDHLRDHANALEQGQPPPPGAQPSPTPRGRTP